MTVDDVKQALAAIRDASGDPEIAHSLEDQLHVAVLKAIADRKCIGTLECARLAISSGEIDFPRYYA